MDGAPHWSCFSKDKPKGFCGIMETSFCSAFKLLLGKPKLPVVEGEAPQKQQQRFGSCSQWGFTLTTEVTSFKWLTHSFCKEMPVPLCAGALQAEDLQWYREAGVWGSCKRSLPFAPMAVHKKGSDLTEQIYDTCNTLHQSLKGCSAARATLVYSKTYSNIIR